jgi:hypothetical protein
MPQPELREFAVALDKGPSAEVMPTKKKSK